MLEPEFKISQRGTLTTIDIDMRDKEEFYFLMSADRHFDNPKTDNRLAKRHLDQLKEKGGLLLDFGDLFDAMQGRNDRRGTKGDLKPENKKSAYLDSLIEEATDFFYPYRKNIALLNQGNHESAILKNNETDLTKRLAEKLGCLSGGYRGWIKLRFRKTETQQHKILLYYSHGTGGGGPVTRGVISTNRMAVYLPDAEIVVQGHIHESWQVEVPRVRISNDGVERQDSQLHICLPTYKEEFLNAKGGFHHEKGRPPKPLGATWLKFHFFREHLRYEPMRAA